VTSSIHILVYVGNRRTRWPMY